MFVRVTCAGVPVGTAEFNPPQGLSHALLDATAGYACASAFARRLASQLATTEFWPSYHGDFGSAIASRWGGGRLALEDDTGRELGVNGVVLLEAPHNRHGIRVVADFRPDLARKAADLRPVGRTGGTGLTRPAA